MTDVRTTLRRALGWFGWGLLAVVLAALCLVAVVLTTNFGLRLVLELALDAYDGRIAGSAAIERVEGRLLDRFVLHGVALRDRAGFPLITAESIAVEWSPWRLLGGEVVVRELRVERPRVELTDRSGEPGRFGDLAPPTTEPEDPDAPPGPELPIGLDVALAIRGAAVVDAGEAVVADAGLDAALQAAGRVARIELSDAHARLRGAPALRDLDARLRWSSPVVALEELRARADGAELRVPAAELDVSALRGALELRAAAAVGVLAAWLPASATEPLRDLGSTAELAVVARGGPEDMSATLRAGLAPGLELVAEAAGAWRGAPRVDIRLRADLDLGPWTGGELGRVRPEIALRGRALPEGPLVFAALLRCPACGGVEPVSGELAGLVDRARDDLALRAEIAVAGVVAGVRLRALGGELRRLDWALSSPRLERPADLARRFVPDLPAVGGALAGRGACSGPALRCAGAITAERLVVGDVRARTIRLDGQVHADRTSGTASLRADGLRVGGQEVARAAVRLEVEPTAAAPVEEPPLAVLEGLPPLRAELAAAASRGRRGRGDGARVDLSVTTGEAIRADLRALELAHGPATISLLGPARLVLRARSLRVDGLRLDLGRGRLRLDGVVDRDGPSDLRLELASLSLAALRPFVPARLRPAGSVSAVVRLRGRPEAPRLDAEVALQRIALAGGAIGDLGLALRLGDGRGDAVLAARGPLARRVTLDASLPLRVDLAQRTWSIDPGPARVELRVRELRLLHLTPWLQDARPLGRVDGFFLLEGRLGGADERPLASPRILSEWRGRDLALARVPLGDVDVGLYHRGEWLRGTLDLHRRRARARLDVQAPVTFDLVRRRIMWDRERDHRGLLRVTGVEIGRQLAGATPGRGVRGRAELRAELFGPATAPRVRAVLRARDLLVRDLSFGSCTLRATMDRGATEVSVEGGRGWIGAFRVHAQAPIAAGIDGVAWRRDGWYAAEAHLDDVDLGALERLAGVSLRGRMTTDLSFDGAGPRSRLAGSLQIHDLEYRERPVGRLGAEFALRDGSIRVQGRGRLGRRTALRFASRVPFDVDLTTAAVGWRPDRTTTLSLDVTGIDGEMLAPLSPIPNEGIRGLDLQLRAELDQRHVRGHVRVDGALGDAALPAAPVSAQLVVDDANQSLRARLGERGARGSLALTADAAVPLPDLLRGEGDLLASRIRGELSARGVDLRYLDGLLPDSLHGLTGSLAAELALAGRIGRPIVRGSARVRRGGVTVVPLQQRFRDLAADVVAEGRTITVERVVAASGQGSVRLRGAATFEPGGTVVADAELRTRRFPVIRPGLPQMTVDTRVRADVRSSPEALDVALAVRGTEVWVSDFTTRAPQPIPENENVELVAGPLAELDAALGAPDVGASDAEEVETSGGDAEEPAPQDMRVRVALVDPVHIQGPTMDMRWRGRITARTTDGDLQVSGSFDTDRGRFELLGNQFRIEQGRVFLPAGADTLDPFLNLVARAATGGYDVTVTLRGRLSRPELRLRSQPGLTESQIFALLLTGTVDSSESDPRKTQASAAGLLLNFSNPTLARFADQRLGIDRLKFGFADDINQPVLTIGKHVTRSLYVESTYHHHAPPRQNRIELRVEYFLSPRWSLESSYGDAAVGSVDVFWRRVFGLGSRGLVGPDTPSPSYSPTPSPTP